MAVKRLLRYVKGSLDQAIIFPKRGGKGGLRLTIFSEAPPKTEEGEPELTVFSDADMAGNIDGRWSTSGVLVFLGAALTAWQSLKQKIVALSTCERVRRSTSQLPRRHARLFGCAGCWAS